MFCEFLDIDRMVPYPEPWVKGYFELPLDAVWGLVDRQRMAVVRTEDNSVLRAQIAVQGQREPGELVIRKGRTTLQEGHHRLLVLTELGKPTMKLTFRSY